MKTVIYTLAAVCIITASCKNTSLPTEEMALKKLSEKQTLKDNEMFEFTELKKINGMEGEVMGHKVYVLDFHAKKIARQDLRQGSFAGQPYYVTDSAAVADSVKISQYKQRLIDFPKYVKLIKKGELIKEFDGQVNFEEKENGWQ